MSRRKLPPIPCVVCGEPVVYLSVEHGKLRSRRRNYQTCCAPECRAAVLLRPELRDASRIVALPAGRGASVSGALVASLSRGGVELVARYADGLLLDGDDEAELLAIEDRYLAEGRRWASALDDGYPWSRSCSLSIVLRVVGEERRPTLRISRGRRDVHRVLHDSWPRMHRMLADVFLAWRCPCENDHQVVYASIEDVPTNLGYHDACPRCGAAPIEVIP